MKKPNIFSIYIFLFFSFYSFGCSSTPIPLIENASIEYYRTESPDGEVDALLMQSNGGATTSFSYDLFIVPKGQTAQKLSLDYSQFGADKVKDLKIAWIENRILQIDCKKARIFRFSNFWQSEGVQNYNYIVEIRISSTCRLNN
jgi:hypothetical protein